MKHARATRRQLETLVGEAVEAGELAAGVQPRALARVVETAIGGSLMTWACYQEGTAARWIRHDLEAVLRPHLPARRR